MAEEIKFNPLTGDFDIVGVSSGNDSSDDSGSVSVEIAETADGDENFNLVLKPVSKHIQ